MIRQILVLATILISAFLIALIPTIFLPAHDRNQVLEPPADRIAESPTYRLEPIIPEADTELEMIYPPVDTSIIQTWEKWMQDTTALTFKRGQTR